jgi:hypothetical protein
VLAVGGAALAVPGAQAATRHAGDVQMGIPTKLDQQIARMAGQGARSHTVAPNVDVPTPPVGTVKDMPQINRVTGRLEWLPFTLRASGAHIEVWVANDLLFPAGDCRNDGVRETVTDAQAQYLADQFDTNMFPKESVTFSNLVSRSGVVTADGHDMQGPGDKVVTLVYNIKDPNYFDLPNNLSYIAGFFSAGLDRLTGRNMMTIDAFDWLHRTGATPPNDPVPGDNCLNANARPFLYEGTFAHEYQHLLEADQDPGETSWVNEGLSDFAIQLTGYTDAARPVTEIGFDSHIQCILGWLGVQTDANPTPRDGGPENSLTLWGDQDFDHSTETLCDYGAAFSFMTLLEDRYGESFMSRLHRDRRHGLTSVSRLLKEDASAARGHSVVHDWAAMLALDGALDSGATLVGGNAARYSNDSMNATINWDTTDAYDTPGAPPNGSDYVRLRDGSGTYLNASQLRSLSLAVPGGLTPIPVQWTVDPSPPGHEGDAAFDSAPDPNTDSNLDAAIIHEVTVPSSDATLSFDTQWSTEEGFDFGAVQISTDGGHTWTSLSNADTTSDNFGTDDRILENLPGFNGESGGWRHETFDLSPWAGQTVLLSFRYMTDVNTEGNGWWVDNVMVGGTLIADGTSLDGWQSLTELVPVPLRSITLQLISYSSAGGGTAYVKRVVVQGGRSWSASGAKLQRFLGGSNDVVAAIVTYNDRTETVTQYAPYTLTVNGVTQPGGS